MTLAGPKTITGRTDRRTDRQTDRRTDRVRRIMRPPPKEEGRIIIVMVDRVKNMWSSAHTCPCPEGAAAHKQSAWDTPVVTAERKELMKTLTSTVDQAWLLAVRSPHSGDWLHALPLSGCGLRLDDKGIHIAVGLRL